MTVDDGRSFSSHLGSCGRLENGGQAFGFLHSRKIEARVSHNIVKLPYHPSAPDLDLSVFRYHRRSLWFWLLRDDLYQFTQKGNHFIFILRETLITYICNLLRQREHREESSCSWVMRFNGDSFSMATKNRVTVLVAWSRPQSYFDCKESTVTQVAPVGRERGVRGSLINNPKQVGCHLVT